MMLVGKNNNIILWILNITKYDFLTKKNLQDPKVFFLVIVNSNISVEENVFEFTKKKFIIFGT